MGRPIQDDLLLTIQIGKWLKMLSVSAASFTISPYGIVENWYQRENWCYYE